jgi:hypothetical protein
VAIQALAVSLLIKWFGIIHWKLEETRKTRNILTMNKMFYAFFWVIHRRLNFIN